MKKKKKEVEKEIYEIGIYDWRVDFSFGENFSRYVRFRGDFDEYSSLILVGTIIHPVFKKARKAEVHILETPQLDDHWKENPPEDITSATGSMQTLRDGYTLWFFSYLPPRIFRNVLASVASNKIRTAMVFGTKLKWGSGLIFRVSLSTIREE